MSGYITKLELRGNCYRHRQSKEASIVWSQQVETRELPGERNNAQTEINGESGVANPRQ